MSSKYTADKGQLLAQFLEALVSVHTFQEHIQESLTSLKSLTESHLEQAQRHKLELEA